MSFLIVARREMHFHPNNRLLSPTMVLLTVQNYSSFQYFSTCSRQASRLSIAAQSFFEILCQLVSRPVLLVLCLLFEIPLVLLLQMAIDAQFWIGMGVCGTTKTGVAPVIQGTILQAKVTNEGPNLRVMPIDNRMNTNKIRPTTICTIEMGQIGTMRIRTPRANENSLNRRIQLQVIPKTRLQRRPRRIGGIFDNVQMIRARRRAHKVLDRGE